MKKNKTCNEAYKSKMWVASCDQLKIIFMKMKTLMQDQQ